MPQSTPSRIAYIGPAGAGFGFQLAGSAVHECSDASAAITLLRRLKSEKSADIIFIDEGLAEGRLGELAALNQEALPAIMLLPNPANPKNIAAANLQQLMVRAVGSDIFN